MKADGRCKSCAAPITWAITAAKGNRMPLDPDPVPDGNVWIVEHREHMSPVIGVALQHSDIPDDIETYVSHFVTCANAAEHRRKKR
jgi:hypothetical protein